MPSGDRTPASFCASIAGKGSPQTTMNRRRNSNKVEQALQRLAGRAARGIIFFFADEWAGAPEESEKTTPEANANWIRAAQASDEEANCLDV